MIHVRFQPSREGPPIIVAIEEGKHPLESILTRAAERVGAPFDQKAEDASAHRFREIMAARARQRRK